MKNFKSLLSFMTEAWSRLAQEVVPTTPSTRDVREVVSSVIPLRPWWYDRGGVKACSWRPSNWHPAGVKDPSSNLMWRYWFESLTSSGESKVSLWGFTTKKYNNPGVDWNPGWGVRSKVCRKWEFSSWNVESIPYVSLTYPALETTMILPAFC